MEKLTKKQKGFVKDYVKTEDATQAALNHYDVKDGKVSKERVAEAIGSENLSKPIIQEAIKSIADRIPDELLEKVHLEGLKAGRLIGTELEADYAVRHKYLDSAYKLKGSYAPDKTLNINMNIKPIDPTNPEVLDLIDKLRKANENQ